MANINVVTIIDGEVNFEANIQNTLTSFQDIVGGHIEIPYVSSILSEHGIDMIINEEGKLIDLPFTIALIVNNDKIVDIVHGNVVFASHDGEGNTTALSDNQKDVLRNLLKTKAILGTSNGDDVYPVFIIPVE